MYSYFKGTYAMATDTGAVIECGGVGYLLFVSEYTRRKLPHLGEEATLFCHLYLREDVMDLYGFAETSERDLFRLLLSVSGVGPKVALGILSQLSPNQLAICVASADAKALTACSGVGPKLAQRMVLELKDKITNEKLTGFDHEAASSNLSAEDDVRGQTVAALLALGYSQSEAASALREVDCTTGSTEACLKTALRQLMRK